MATWALVAQVFFWVVYVSKVFPARVVVLVLYVQHGQGNQLVYCCAFYCTLIKVVQLHSLYCFFFFVPLINFFLT